MKRKLVSAWPVSLFLLLLMSSVALAMQPAALAFAQEPIEPASKATPKAEKRITPDEAKKLFSMVDELSAYAAKESGLKAITPVKRQLISRKEVDRYLRERFDEDEGAKRFEQGELVLKKFGMLNRDFALKPFLLDLLKEQIEAYYDTKRKTIFLLDWVSLDEQRPVLAHELTHALQDSRVGLEKWSDQSPTTTPTNVIEDQQHLDLDEAETARQAVAEGQATAVMMNLALKPSGKSVEKDAELAERLEDGMSATDDTPLLAQAPLLISESLLFPYREGFGFTRQLWADKGRDAAFAAALDHPPSSTWEILHPEAYEQHQTPPVPTMPDVHPLLDKDYRPYDIGQIGELDLRILLELMGGDDAVSDLLPDWNGGLYWAGQRRDASPAEQKKTSSLGLIYFSSWKDEDSAESFAQLYADTLDDRYGKVQRDEQAEASAPDKITEEIYQSPEGSVLIALSHGNVFVAESFPLDQAQSLAQEFFSAQGQGPTRIATADQPKPSLSSSLAGFLARCGVVRAAMSAKQ